MIISFLTGCAIRLRPLLKPLVSHTITHVHTIQLYRYLFGGYSRSFSFKSLIGGRGRGGGGGRGVQGKPCQVPHSWDGTPSSLLVFIAYFHCSDLLRHRHPPIPLLRCCVTINEGPDYIGFSVYTMSYVHAYLHYNNT